MIIKYCFGMNYDEIISTTAYKIYTYKPAYIKRAYKLNKYKDYYEIYNMNITLTIYNHDLLIKKLKNNLEEAYYFKYNANDEYYILAEYPLSCELCGFIILSKDHEFNQNNIILINENDKLKIKNDILLNNKAKNDLFNTDIDIIKQNYFECLTSTKLYNIKKNREKPYIFLITSDKSKISINNTIEYNEYFYFIENEEGAYLAIYGEQYNKICFDLIYNDKSKFEIKPGETEMVFNVFYIQTVTLEFNLKDMDMEKSQYISLYDQKYNLYLRTYYIDGKEYNYIYDRKYIEFDSKKEAKIEILVNLQLSGQIGQLRISFDIKGVEKKEEEIKPENHILIIIASCFAYVCFAAVGIIFFYIMYYVWIVDTDIKNSLDLIDLPISLTWQKLESVYLCKRNIKKK